MSRRALAASSLVAAMAATSGVALALHAHGGSSGAAAATSAATPAPPVHATLGEFHVSSNDFKLDSDARSEVVMTQVTLHAGSSSQWHTHPGPGFIVVTSGALTLYQVIHNNCVTLTYGPGQGWVEAPGVIHMTLNKGTTDATAMATFLDIAPGTTAYKTIVPAPAACPGIK